MAKFDVYLGDRKIGWSELEFGDPPMGVAFGRFIPNSEYSSTVADSKGQGVLSVRTSSGALINASGGVHLADHSATLGAEGMEVSVLGIPGREYEILFPQHVAAYES